MCEAAYFRSVKVQFLEHSRRLLELSDDDKLQAWFEPHFASGMRLIVGGTGVSCGADKRRRKRAEHRSRRQPPRLS